MGSLVHQILPFRHSVKLKLLRASSCSLCGKIKHCSSDSQQRKLVRVFIENNGLRAAKTLKILSEEDLLERFRNLEKLKVVNFASLDAVRLLSIHPTTIQNRVEALQEAGFLPEAINVQILARYLRVTSMPVSELKSNLWIHKNADVMSNILKHVDLEPQFYPEEVLDQSTTLLEIRIAVLRAFLKRKFGFTDQQLDEKKSKVARLWHKSYATINRNIHLVHKEIGMSLETVGCHLFLLAVNPVNTDKILKEVATIGEIDIITALNARPKILCNTLENMKRIIALLEQFGVLSRCNYTALKLFTLSHETIKRRLDELDTIEYFSYLKKHPRILSLVLLQAAAKRRLKYLEEANLNPMTLNGLITKSVFERYLSEGYTSSSAKDILSYLSNLLNCNVTELKKQLNKHPHWKDVSLMLIGRNQQFLSKYMSRDDMVKCPFILFYPQGKIEAKIFNLETMEELEVFKENGKIQAKFIGPLLTYYFEKECNFSFEAVWYSDTASREAMDAPYLAQENNPVL